MYTFYVLPGLVEEGVAAAPSQVWEILKESKYKSVVRFGWTKNRHKLFPENWYPILVEDLPRKADAIALERRFKFLLMVAQTFGDHLLTYVPGSMKLLASNLSLRDLQTWLKKVDKKIRSHPVGPDGSHRLS